MLPIIILLEILVICYSSLTPITLRALDSVAGRSSFYQLKFIFDRTINDSGAVAGVLIAFPSEIPGSLMMYPC